MTKISAQNYLFSDSFSEGNLTDSEEKDENGKENSK
jgi:hypothetical protein